MSKYSSISLSKEDKDKAHLTVVNNKTSEKKFLTLREVSELWNMPLGTLRIWALQRKFKLYKLPSGRIRVKALDFEKWYEKYSIDEVKVDRYIGDLR